MSSDVSNSLQKWVRLPPNPGLTDLKPVSIYDVTKFPDTRTQKLRSLLEQGHVTVAPLRDPELILHMKENQGYLGKVLEEYLYSGEALMNGYTGGLGRPFIHLAYAYEFRSKEVATQALGQGCTEYNALHTLLDQAPPDSSKYKTGSLAVVFESMLWHYFPTSRGVSILKQYALFGIMTYICQLRPQFSLDWI
ncbi:hypothetical protein AnigIFM56816_011490 [Aspergillus niger]|nr:hypothetical protein AnigIFM56816_011490 [Aspergillus niger]